ncbi:hypothetical protein HDV00_011699 [Rhizophlyctis rosea]|nr:hypothetical protein HDV00_011699 [Rhizophlyctis rosea]
MAGVWYRHAYEDADPIGAYYEQDHHRFRSTGRFTNLVYLQDASAVDSAVDEGLRQMLEDEMFPLWEFFSGLPRYSYWHDREPQILWHPMVRNRLKLSDIISQLDLYVLHTETLDLVHSLLESAPRHEILTFTKHVQYLLDTKPHWEIADKLISEFPNVISIQSQRTHHLRGLIRSSSTEEIESQITQGVYVNHTQLYYDLSYIMSKQGSIEGWCQAISALQKHHSDPTWLADPRQQYYPERTWEYLSLHGNLDNLMYRSVFCTFRPSLTNDYEGEYLMCGPVTPQFEVLESYIRSNKIQWWPFGGLCFEWAMVARRYVGDSARRLEAFFFWMEQRFGLRILRGEGGDGNDHVFEVTEDRFPMLEEFGAINSEALM